MMRLLEALADRSVELEHSWAIARPGDDEFTDRGHGEFSQESGSDDELNVTLRIYGDSQGWLAYDFSIDGIDSLEIMPAECEVAGLVGVLSMLNCATGDILVSGSAADLSTKFRELLNQELTATGSNDFEDVVHEATAMWKESINKVFPSGAS